MCHCPIVLGPQVWKLPKSYGDCEQGKPDVVIVVDALASMSTMVSTTIQIGDTGIQPGSGVGSRRFGITRIL